MIKNRKLPEKLNAMNKNLNTNETTDPACFLGGVTRRFACEEVKNHWRKISEGIVPFGFSIVED